jgi:hypothetical protein
VILVKDLQTGTFSDNLDKEEHNDGHRDGLHSKQINYRGKKRQTVVFAEFYQNASDSSISWGRGASGSSVTRQIVYSFNICVCYVVTQ